MPSNEIEVLEPAATVETLTKIKARRAMDRRRFMTAVGVAGAVSGVALASRSVAGGPRVVEAAGPTQNDILNFVLNLKFLEATFYSYITQGTDLPGTLVIGSGAITGNPAKLVFTGTNAAQITDMFNELYFDELSHVKDLMSILGTAAIARPAINLAAYTAVSATTAIGIARLIEDVGVTALAGQAPSLTGANLTYASQIMGVEAMHSGYVRLVAIQNPAPAIVVASGGSLFTGTLTSGSTTIANIFFSTVTLNVGDILLAPALPQGVKVTAVAIAKNAAITGTTTIPSPIITAISSVTNLAVGQLITGTGIPAGATIIAVGTTTITISAATTGTAGTVTTGVALTVGVGSVTLSANAIASGTNTSIAKLTDNMEVLPVDPGTPALSAAGPSPTGGFFATAGPSTATNINPAGMAFARTSSQVLAIMYATPSIGPAVAGTTKGGFFPSGVNGVINTV